MKKTTGVIVVLLGLWLAYYCGQGAQKTDRAKAPVRTSLTAASETEMQTLKWDGKHSVQIAVPKASETKRDAAAAAAFQRGKQENGGEGAHNFWLFGVACGFAVMFFGGYLYSDLDPSDLTWNEPRAPRRREYDFGLDNRTSRTVPNATAPGRKTLSPQEEIRRRYPMPPPQTVPYYGPGTDEEAEDDELPAVVPHQPAPDPILAKLEQVLAKIEQPTAIVPAPPAPRQPTEKELMKAARKRKKEELEYLVDVSKKTRAKLDVTRADDNGNEIKFSYDPKDEEKIKLLKEREGKKRREERARDDDDDYQRKVDNRSW